MEKDINRIVTEWEKVNKVKSYDNGVMSLTKLIVSLGYSNIEEFLDFNPGIQNLIVSSIRKSDNNYWKESLLDDIEATEIEGYFFPNDEKRCEDGNCNCAMH